MVKAITQASWPSALKVALKGPCQGSASPKGCTHAHGGYNLGTGCDNGTIWTWGMFVIVTCITGCEQPSGSHLNMAVCRLHPHGVTLLGDAQRGLGSPNLGARLCRGPSSGHRSFLVTQHVHFLQL